MAILKVINFDIETMKFAFNENIREFYTIDNDDNKVMVDWDGVTKDDHYMEDDSFLRFTEELRETIYEDSHEEYVKDLLDLAAN